MEEVRKWLNSQFTRKLVSEVLNLEEKKVLSVVNKTKKTLEEGENFFGLILSEEVCYTLNCEHGSLYLIIKTTPSGPMSDFSNAFHVFPKEVAVYKSILPAFQGILDKGGVEVSLGPKCYYAETERKIIVLEDLTKKGFQLRNRTTGLDLEHTFLALESLAAWHAASLVYRSQFGEFEDIFRTGLYHKGVYDIEGFANYHRNHYKSFKLAISQWEDFDVEAREVESWGEDFYLRMARTLEPHEHSFNVLCHGDPWTNNLMFDYEDGVPKSCKMLDFQLPHWGSPAVDLLYFITTSVQKGLKEKFFDAILAIYHYRLREFMGKLGLSETKYTLEDLHRDVNERISLACLVTMESLSLMLLPKEHPVNHELNGADSPDGFFYRFENYCRPHYVQVARKYLKFLLKRAPLWRNSDS